MLPVQMTGKVPEARFAAKSTVYKNIESADAKKSRVSLTPRKYVECWVAKPDVTNDIGWFQKIVQCHGW